MKWLECKIAYEDAPLTVVRTVMAVPVCEEDFCMACGECIACAPGDDTCPWTLSGKHDFQRTEERPPPALGLVE